MLVILQQLVHLAHLLALLHGHTLVTVDTVTGTGTRRI